MHTPTNSFTLHPTNNEDIVFNICAKVFQGISIVNAVHSATGVPSLYSQTANAGGLADHTANLMAIPAK